MKSFLTVVILLTMSCFASGQCVGCSGFSSGSQSSGYQSSGFYPSNVYKGYSGSYGGFSSRYARPYSKPYYGTRPYRPGYVNPYVRPYRPSYVNPYVRPNYNRPYRSNNYGQCR